MFKRCNECGKKPDRRDKRRLKYYILNIEFGQTYRYAYSLIVVLICPASAAPTKLTIKSNRKGAIIGICLSSGKGSFKLKWKTGFSDMRMYLT